MLNNPINFTDPSGHCADNPTGNNGCILSDGTGNNAATLPYPPPPTLPSSEPPGLNEYGQAAWLGLQNIQQMSGGWWGNTLDAQEAIMLILNHELGTELGEHAHHAPLDVLINQYNAYCSGGAWSTECLNKFWGYSQVIRESRVALDGGDRFSNTAHKQWLRQTASGILNHTLQPTNPALMHYGNAFGQSARHLLYDYTNNVMTYATYVNISGYLKKQDGTYELDENGEKIVSSVFAVQTYNQWQLTGTLQDWVYP